MIYLDHNATTPVLPEAAEAMQDWLTRHFGNPSSVHRSGRLARQAVDQARAAVAALVGCQPGEVVFTSGGTEADNLALQAVQGEGARVLVGATEHAAVLEAAQARARHGVALQILPVDRQGLIAEATLREALSAYAGPQLVSIMWANNETGVIQDVITLGRCAREYGAIMHSDAVQAAGKLVLDFANAPVDLLSLSAHKINGPKGVGALIVRNAVALPPILFGGGHERGRRAGTENLPGIVGFGVAAGLVGRQLEQRTARARALVEQLEQGLEVLPQVEIIARDVERVGNTCQFTVAGFHSEALLMELDRRDIAVASGSACHAGTGRPSHVLLAMGYGEEQAHGAIRVSFGQGNVAADVERFVQALRDIIARPPLAAGLLVN